MSNLKWLHWAWDSRFFIVYHPRKTREWGILYVRKLRKTGKKGVLRLKRVQLRIISCDYDWTLVLINSSRKSITKTAYYKAQINSSWVLSFQGKRGKFREMSWKIIAFKENSGKIFRSTCWYYNIVWFIIWS